MWLWQWQKEVSGLQASATFLNILSLSPNRESDLQCVCRLGSELCVLSSPESLLRVNEENGRIQTNTHQQRVMTIGELISADVKAGSFKYRHRRAESWWGLEGWKQNNTRKALLQGSTWGRWHPGNWVCLCGLGVQGVSKRWPQGSGGSCEN